MPVSVGNIVRPAGSTDPLAIGRICKDNGATWCVYWKVTETCVRVGKGSLEVTAGEMPACPNDCTAGC